MSIVQWIKWLVKITLAAFPLPVDMIKREEGVEGSSEDPWDEVTFDDEQAEYHVVQAMAGVQMRQRWGKDMSHID